MVVWQGYRIQVIQCKVVWEDLEEVSSLCKIILWRYMATERQSIKCIQIQTISSFGWNDYNWENCKCTGVYLSEANMEVTDPLTKIREVDHLVTPGSFTVLLVTDHLNLKRILVGRSFAICRFGYDLNVYLSETNIRVYRSFD